MRDNWLSNRVFKSYDDLHALCAAARYATCANLEASPEHRRRHERGFKHPPRMQISTSHGVTALEAKWLVPAGAIPADIAKDPKSCLIAVTVELRELAVAHAVRILRESGATPAQVRVGIQPAMGKTKPVIADDLGITLSSVEGLTKKLYQTLDVHNSGELGTKVWLGELRRTNTTKRRAS